MVQNSTIFYEYLVAVSLKVINSNKCPQAACILSVSVQLAGTWIHSLGAASPEAAKSVLKSEEMEL